MCNVYIWCDLICYSIWLSYYSAVSGSGVSFTFLTRIFNISIKWHAIYTVLLSIVHLPVCVTNIISGICCHAFLLCATHMSYILSVLKLFFVGICVVHRCLFFQFVLDCLLKGLSLWVCPDDPRGITQLLCIGFTCFLFLVISHPVFVTHVVYDLSLWSWSPFPTIVTMGPQSTIFSLNCYSRTLLE